jgi:excinuclease ABC subunit B
MGPHNREILVSSGAAPGKPDFARPKPRSTQGLGGQKPKYKGGGGRR